MPRERASISNHDFGDAAFDQVHATQSQCSVFVFGDNYHTKVLVDNGNLTLRNYYSFDQTKTDEYDTTARELVAFCLVIRNSLSSRTRLYLKDQYVVNQSNYPDIVVTAVLMITSFGTDIGNERKKLQMIALIQLYLST